MIFNTTTDSYIKLNMEINGKVYSFPIYKKLQQNYSKIHVLQKYNQTTNQISSIQLQNM
jgi:hypothetical protein